MSERDDRGAAAAGRRRGEGARDDALRGGPAGPRPAARPARARRARRTRASPAIDTEAALAVPGVVAVLTAADLPVSPDAPGRAGEPLAREEVVFAGQPVALVVAETEAAAEDGVDQVVVDLEPLEAVLDLEAAMAPGAPARSHGRVGARRRGRRRRPRVGRRRGRRRARGGALRQRHRAPAAGERRRGGGARRGRRDVSGRLRHELGPPGLPRAAVGDRVARARRRGSSCSASTQGAFATRQGLAELLGLPLDRVRVRPAPLGGAFGGKLMMSEPLAAAAALAC